MNFLLFNEKHALTASVLLFQSLLTSEIVWRMFFNWSDISLGEYICTVGTSSNDFTNVCSSIAPAKRCLKLAMQTTTKKETNAK